jgi:hypothetical protein
MRWRMATWLDTESGEAIQAPAYRAANGVWYRASEQDGLPCILRCDSAPTAFLTYAQQSASKSAPDELRDRIAAIYESCRRAEIKADVTNSYLDIISKQLSRGTKPLDAHGLTFFPAPSVVMGKIS